VLQVALAWQLHLDYVTAPIIGANTVAQLEESLGACAVELSAAEMARLNEVSSWE
jgi:aryl-alcohol dehydrogenase-like predicted oxidoreductase